MKKKKRLSKKNRITRAKISSPESDRILSLIKKTKEEISKVVVGQDDIVDGLIRAIIANGHVLVEGVPGIAKTLTVRALAVATGCEFKRIQFTVDLLPTDIIGITSLSPDKSEFEILKGPVFSNFVIADEINRAPPKTQSALLEAMGEKQVSIGRETYSLHEPFFVMATQNPIESAGTYPLPEAQMDRFLFKLLATYPKKEEEERIIEQNIALKSFDSYGVKQIMSPKDIISMQKLVQEVQHTPRINKYIVDLVNATRNWKDYNLNLGKYIAFGASPRASIYLFLGAKADAFVNGQKFVNPSNIKSVACDAMRHRIILNYRAQIDNVTSDDIINEILSKVRVP